MLTRIKCFSDDLIGRKIVYNSYRNYSHSDNGKVGIITGKLDAFAVYVQIANSFVALTIYNNVNHPFTTGVENLMLVSLNKQMHFQFS